MAKGKSTSKGKGKGKTEEKTPATSLGKAGSEYEIIQDFTDYGDPKTEFKKGQDASGIHPGKLSKYIAAGFVAKKVI